MDRDLIIIGGGPAGLAAAIYAGRADLRVALLEKGLPGGQVAMTTDIANYPGFPEGVDGPTLAENMRAQAARFGVEFLQADAGEVTRAEGGFAVALPGGRLTAAAVVAATGSDPRKLGVPGEERLRGRGVSYCGTCDAPFFRNKKVVAVGGGDTALKESLHLAKFASGVTLVHRRDAFRAEKIYQKQVLGSEKIAVHYNAIVTEVLGDKTVRAVRLKDTVTGAETEFATDGVFVFVGTTPNTALLRGLAPEMVDGHVVTNVDMMSSIPGLFAVGDVRAHSYRQVATAVGEGATAAMSAEHYLSNLST